MRNRGIPLDNIKVASPCPADWNAMVGDVRKRFCAQCELNVYNLSGMTRQEAEALIMKSEGRLCVRFYRRGDGTILTKDCPVGLTAIRRRVSRIRRAVMSSVLGFLSGLGLNFAFGSRLTTGRDYPLMGTMVSSGVMQGDLAVQPEPLQGQAVGNLMGRIVVAKKLKETRRRGLTLRNR